MVKEFKIIHVSIHHNRGLFIFAKHLGEHHNFNVNEGSILRDLPVYHYKEIEPRDEVTGKLQEDIFVFRPVDMDRLFDQSFKEGDTVSLVLSE